MVKTSRYFSWLLLTVLPLIQACDHHKGHHEHAKNQNLRKLRQRGEDMENVEFIFDAPEYLDLGFKFQGKYYNSSMEFVDANMRCRTRDLVARRQAQVLAFVEQLLGNVNFHSRAFEDKEIVINTYVHVVYKTHDGHPTNVPQSAITKQIKILNDAFAGVTEEYSDCFSKNTTGIATPFRFELKNITRVLQTDWHNGFYDDEMRRQLRVGNCSDLNIFITNARGSLGYASLASWCDNNKLIEDMVNINWETLPDLKPGKFSQGDTMVHEVGHWLGLEHTFEGGCFGAGDGVADTPPQRTPGYGCFPGRDTCTGGGPDPIFNFMDYSDDCCMYTFSEGQSDRMTEHSVAYRNLTFTPIVAPTPSPVPEAQLDVLPPGPPPPPVCPTGQMQVDVKLKFDEFPQETSYEILEVETMTTLFTFQGRINQAFKNVTNQYCFNATMQTKQFVFLIKDQFGDGMGATGTYEIQINSQPYAAGGAFEVEEAVAFGKPLSCPKGKTPFLMVLQTDRNGEQNSWIMRDDDTGDVFERVRPDTYSSNALYFETRCIKLGVKTRWAFRDYADDGICCANGPGYFSTFLGNEKLKDGGRFDRNIAAVFNT